jgi:hypothetical protein
MSATAKYVDPNPYGDYGPAMKKVPGRPMAIEWHLTDRAAIDKATAPEALEEILDDDDRIEALLAKVKPNYGTDAMDAARIAAISQYVMENADVSWWEFWRDDRSDEREDWAKALLKAAFNAKDDYVAIYFLDQLRWCGMCCQVPCLNKLSAKTSSKAVKDMVAIVVDQIACCRAGR